MSITVDDNQIQCSLLREAEAGKLLGLSVHALRARRLKGKPPRFIRLGRSIRYRPEDLKSYLEQCIVGA